MACHRRAAPAARRIWPASRDLSTCFPDPDHRQPFSPARRWPCRPGCMTPLVALPRLLWAAFGALAAVALGAAPYSAASRWDAGSGVALLALAAGLLAAALIRKTAGSLSLPLGQAQRWLDGLPFGRALAAIVALGVLLRAIAAATLGQDASASVGIHFDLSVHWLAAGDAVRPGGALPFRPPGHAILLAAVRALPGLGEPTTAIAAVNLAAFAVTAPASGLLGRALFGPAAGLAAAVALALWPTLVLGAPLPIEAVPLLALLTIAWLGYMRAQRRGGVVGALGAGFLLGAALLLQPMLLLLPASLVLAEILHPDSLRQAVLRLTLATAGVLLVAGPWIGRNAQELVAWATVANSGTYSAQSAGRVKDRAELLRPAPITPREDAEVDAYARQLRLAMQSMAQEPHRFLQRSADRLLRSAGDDASSARTVMPAGSAARAAAVAASNAWWLALWCLALVALARGAPQTARPPGAWLLAVNCLYLALVEAIAAGDASRHLVLAAPLSILAASALYAALPNEKAEARGPRHPAAQFVDFAVVGAVGTAAHFTVLILLVQSADWPPVAATTAGFGVGALVNYTLSYWLVFQSRARHVQALPRFLAVALVTMLLNAIIFWALVHGGGLHYLIAQVIATAVVLVANFVANRTLTFASTEQG